jgi:hypothetical protein
MIDIRGLEIIAVPSDQISDLNPYGISARSSGHM